MFNLSNLGIFSSFLGVMNFDQNVHQTSNNEILKKLEIQEKVILNNILKKLENLENLKNGGGLMIPKIMKIITEEMENIYRKAIDDKIGIEDCKNMAMFYDAKKGFEHIYKHKKPQDTIQPEKIIYPNGEIEKIPKKEFRNNFEKFIFMFIEDNNKMNEFYKILDNILSDISTYQPSIYNKYNKIIKEHLND